MHVGWVGMAILLIVSSNALYLLIRQAQKLDIGLAPINVAQFAVPCLTFLLLILARGTSMAVSLQNFGVIAVTAFLFNYMGNMFALRSIKTAPNPGYPLIISKSYVIITAPLSVPLFHSTLTIRSVVAIAIVVIFEVLIALPDKKAAKIRIGPWLLYAVGALLCWSGLALASTYVLGHGVDVFVYLFYLTLIVSVCTVMAAGRSLAPAILLPASSLVLLGAMGVASMLFNVAMQVGYKMAPNPGYINAANAGSIALLTLASAAVFRDELTGRKVVGVFGVTAGLLLLFV
jgi:drug/metabolite transporter (DMT)-like permease